MRTGMSWITAGLLGAGLLCGHRMWAASASAGPPEALSAEPAALAIPEIPREDSLETVAGEELLPDNTPPVPTPGELPPAAPTTSPAEEKLVREVIREEMSDASEEEREIFFEQLRSLPAGVVRDLLKVRRHFGPAQSGDILSPSSAEQPRLAARPLVAEPASRRRSSGQQTIHGAAEALQSAIQWHQHNLLNSLTPGFRRVRVMLVDQTAPGESLEPGIQLAPLVLDINPGEIETTGRPLDIALLGPVLLAVKADGADRFTRCGALLINGDRRLATVASAGQVTLHPEVLIPEGIAEVGIEADGSVVGCKAGGVPAILGRLPLVTFSAPELLHPVGGTLLAATAQSGAPSPLVSADTSLSLVRPQSLERANVDPTTELNNLQVLKEQLELFPGLASPLAQGAPDSLKTN